MAPRRRDLTSLDDWIKNTLTDLNLNDPITKFTLQDDLAESEGAKRESMKESKNLDSLAKVLEDLIDSDREEDHNDSKSKTEDVNMHEEETEFYFYNSYDTDEKALLDDSIGQCCVLLSNRPWDVSSSVRDAKGVSVSVTAARDSTYERILDRNKDLIRIQTAMPMDHDYLRKPRTKPLVLNRILIKSSRNRQKVSSVLNKEAIKRFVKFSEKFRVLYDKHDGLLAITNN